MSDTKRRRISEQKFLDLACEIITNVDGVRVAVRSVVKEFPDSEVSMKGVRFRWLTSEALKDVKLNGEVDFDMVASQVHQVMTCLSHIFAFMMCGE